MNEFSWVFLFLSSNEKKVTIKWNFKSNYPVNIIGRGKMFYRIIIKDDCQKSGNCCHFQHRLLRESGDARYVIFWQYPYKQETWIPYPSMGHRAWISYPLLLTSGGHHWRPVQTCSPERTYALPVLTHNADRRNTCNCCHGFESLLALSVQVCWCSFGKSLNNNPHF